jgi:hypothetical protein
MKEHPICLMNKCPNYPCRILDSIVDKSVICKEDGFWEKYNKKETEDINP